jgi:DNA-binding transcriptional ArsR family regulator
VLTEVAVVRSESGWATPRSVTQLFEALRIEPPNVSEYLKRLRQDGLVLPRPGGGEWAVQPEGREAVREALADLDYNQIEAELRAAPGAEYLSALNPVIDPALAPPRWSAGVARLHKRFPFETSVFCMTRFPDPGERELPDPVRSSVAALRAAATDHGLALHVASDRQVEDNLFGNVGAFMWGSLYGIGILEDRVGRGLNYNVVTELGSMLILGRRCAILRDRTAPEVPSDLGAELFKRVDLDDVDGVLLAMHRWLSDDLGLAPCAQCPSADL